MKTLHLNLKRKWFDMIEAGIKREEYREIKPHWIKRLVDTTDTYVSVNDVIENLTERFYKSPSKNYSFKKFDTVTFSNGYAKDRKQIVMKCERILIREGWPHWGAEQGKNYFVIKLGEKL